MTTLLSVAAGSLLLLLVVVLASVYAVRREKCCFARRGDFRPSDLESEKSDVDSAAGRKTPALGPPGSGVTMDGTGGGYLTSPARRPPHTITSGGASPDAMKQRRFSANYSKGTFVKDREAKDNLYADLQVPTISNNGSTMVRNHLGRPRQHPPRYQPQFGYTTTSFQPSRLERAEV